MIKVDANEVIDAMLNRCAQAPGSFWEISHLIRLSINDKDGAEDICAIRSAVENKITENSLLTKHKAGWAANDKTQAIIVAGGYIKYIADQQQKNELQDKADEARNRTAIVQWKTIKWSFGMSITAILIAFAALIVSIISIARTT